MVLLTGYLADIYKIVHVLNILNVICVVSSGVMVYEIQEKELADIGKIFDIAFVISYGFHICIF